MMAKADKNKEVEIKVTPTPVSEADIVVVPKITDLEWTDYVLRLLSDDNLVLRLFHLLPKKFIFLRILFVFFFIMQVLVDCPNLF
jgi:hypothetical protein